MARIAERRERPIKIHRLIGRQRFYIATVQGFNLPDAIRRWHEGLPQPPRLADPYFQANTVTVTAPDGEQETYVATD